MEDKVKVKIKPLHNIGGVGKAGDVVWMTPAEAEAYARDGYVEYAAISGELLAESSDPARGETQLSVISEQPVVEDHAVMKPEVKRAKKVVRKK